LGLESPADSVGLPAKIFNTEDTGAHRGTSYAPCASGYSNSTSIFLVAASSLVMRKLRISPVRAGSAFAAGAGPLFQRACSMELNDDRSALFSSRASSFCFAGVAAAMWQVAWIPSPSSARALLPEPSIIRPVTTSPSLCSAIYSSRPVGTSCFMPRRI